MAMRRGRAASTGFIQEFQNFLMKGNVVDLAVAVIIGGAFGKIVSSLVENIVMPVVSLVIPGGEWRSAKFVLGTIADPKDPTKTVENAILIGQFFGAIVDFLVISLVIFLAIRALAKFQRQEEIAAEPAPLDPILESQQALTAAMDRLTRTISASAQK
jgi:large conductance mechanosensitive channel